LAARRFVYEGYTKVTYSEGPRFGRLITAMVTPFKSDGEIDYDRAAELANRLVDSGSDGIVVSGTTGESPTLSHEEDAQLAKVIVDAVGKRAAVIAGGGTNATNESQMLTRNAEKAGVDGILLVVPYYNNPPQEGLYQHFRTVAESTSLPVVLYNIPPRSPRNLEPSTLQRLAKDVPNIVGVKEAAKSMDQVSRYLAVTPPDFMLYSGDDSATLAILALGGCGVISVASHVVGPQIKEMITAHFSGYPARAVQLHHQLMPIFDGLFAAPNPILVKAALELLGFPVGGLRRPLIEATDAERADLKKVLESVL
jgi:4-hydroxy-tetrahydrodipicolinate synthase